MPTYWNPFLFLELITDTKLANLSRERIAAEVQRTSNPSNAAPAFTIHESTILDFNVGHTHTSAITADNTGNPFSRNLTD